MKKFTIVFLVYTLVSLVMTSSVMITQDELGAFTQEANKLIDQGVDKDVLWNYLCQNGLENDIVEATQKLKEAEASGFFFKDKGATTATPIEPAVAPKPAPTPTPTPKHEHKYDAKLTKEPTCYEAGELTHTCECGDSYTEEVAKLEHQYSTTVTKEPTCTEEGEKTFKCWLCGDSYTEVMKANGHTPGQFTVTKEPKCITEGERIVYCNVCGEEIGKEIIEPTGHENTVVLTDKPSFFFPGKDKLVCKRCCEVLETTVIPVPMWHYYLAGGIGGLILILIIVAVVKSKSKK